MVRIIKWVKPKEGVAVYNPAARCKVPAEGMLVAYDNFWKRRALKGDIDVFDRKPAEKKAKAPKPDKSTKESPKGEK